MRSKISIYLSFIISMIINLVVFSVIAEASGTGAIPLTDEERAAIRDRYGEIKEVQYNNLALMRINGGVSPASLNSNVGSVSVGNEIITTKDVEDEAILLGEQPTLSLPTTVDNSGTDAYQLLNCDKADNSGKSYFPGIGNQGTIGSCTAWSMAYYQMTNNLALVNNRVVRNGTSNITANTMSPIWMYNLINDGKDRGSSYYDAANIACNFGCATKADCTTSNSSYKTWNPGAEIWRNALYNKCKAAYILNLDNNSGFENLKKLLCDGYVVSFFTYLSSSNWICTGYNCKYIKDAENCAHLMTIVGYDDTMWIDVNGNGLKDEGEIGALKIANSWGTNWKNKGFAWLSYDAIYDESRVEGFSPNNRIAAIDCQEVILLMPCKDYMPLLTADVTIKTARRNQVKIEFGYKPTVDAEVRYFSVYNNVEYTEYNDDVVYEEYLDTDPALPFNYYKDKNGILNNEETINCNFVGNSTAQVATFSFDLTHIVEKAFDDNCIDENGKLDIYVKISDCNDDNYAVTLSEITIKDVFDPSGLITYITDITVNCNDGFYLISPMLNCVILKPRPITELNTPDLAIKFNNPLDVRTVDISNILFVMFTKDGIPITSEDTPEDASSIGSVSLSDDGKTVYIYLDRNKVSATYNIAANLIVTEWVRTQGGNYFEADKTFNVYLL